jgi:ribose transport system permease protein
MPLSSKTQNPAETVGSASSAAPLPEPSRRLARVVPDGLDVKTVGLVATFAALVLVSALTSPIFLHWSNIKVVLLQSSTIGIVAVPLALLMIAGHLDLSVGALGGLAAVVAAKYWHADGAVIALLAALAVALLVGFGNGLLTSYLRFSPLLVTLGGLTGLRGIAEQISGGLPIGGFGSGFDKVGAGEVAGIPNPVLYCAGAFLLGAFFLYQTSWGRHTRAIGVNVQTTFLSGIDPRRLPLMLYVATALAAAFAGLIEMSQLDSATPTLQLGFEINVLTAVLLGGVAFGGGAGSLLGVLIGVLFLGTLSNTLTLNDVSPFWFQIVSGGVLVVAAGLARLSGTVRFGDRGGAGGTSLKLGAGG